MGFFKDLTEDVAENEQLLDAQENGDDLVSITDASAVDVAGASDEDLSIDASLIENLFNEDQTGAEETEAEEEYQIEAPKEKPVAKAAPQESSGSEDQVTVITKGTTINGSIVSDCSLNVMGTINGDIECIGKLSISGNVVGNSVASDVYVNAKRLDGNIDCEGTVKIGLGTVVVGDIKAGSGVIAGAVKGELDIHGPVVIDSTAIIKGNVKAKSVQMNNGAVLEGFCSLAYSAVDIDDVFE